MKSALTKQDISRIHTEATENKLKLDHYYYTTYISKLMGCGAVNEAQQQFEKAKQQIQPTVEMYNAMIHGYADHLTEIEFAYDPWRMLNEMKSAGIEPDSVEPCCCCLLIDCVIVDNMDWPIEKLYGS